LRGTIVGVTASAVNSAEGEFGAGRIRQQGTDIALSLRHAAIRTRAASMWLNLEVAQSTGDASLENLGLNRDELTMARLGVEAELRDGWGGRTRLNLGATFGRDDFKTPTPAHPMARPDDGAAFTKFTLIANRTQTLADGWSLFAAMRGQVSADDLPEDERITFGGARWGRAYDYSEIEGDTGIAGQLEVRYTSNGLKLVDSLQTYAFADAAASWVRDGEGEADTLSSAGLGLRADFGLGYRAGVEAAVPLNRLPLGQTDRHPRVFATVSREF
jgi:hemolysin activation/secretion protein